MSDVKKAEAIPFDAVITIEVGGGFYGRLHQLLYALASFKTPEEFGKAIALIKEDKANDDPYAYHLETILNLTSAIEEAAKKQGKLQMVNLPEQGGPQS